jgi:hypothetical protein
VESIEGNRMKSLTRTIVLTMLLIGAAGCATDDSILLTQHLWQSESFRRFHEPASDPRLEVYRSEKPPDYLVTYDEVREKDGRIRRRAFYLQANVNRIASRRRPAFVNPAKAAGLEAISVGAIVADGDRWQLRETDGTTTGFSLPTYASRGTTALKILITPFTVTGDTIIVGSIVGVFVASAYAQGNCHNYSTR